MGFSLRLQRFCCCCTLRTGTLIIGTLGWLQSLYQIFMIAKIIHLLHYYDKYEHSEGIRWMKYFFIGNIVAGVTLLLVNVLLVVGAHKKNNKFMLPWLVLKFLLLIVIFFICFGVIFFVNGTFTAQCVGLACYLFLMGGLGCYCWICVWSHYMELKDRNAIVSLNVQYSPTLVSPSPYNKAGDPLV